MAHSPWLAPRLIRGDCEGPRLLIELRICSDPKAASFICLIIVEGGDEGEGGEGGGMALRFHSKKLGA